jgi:hypothetical protein
MVRSRNAGLASDALRGRSKRLPNAGIRANTDERKLHLASNHLLPQDKHRRKLPIDPKPSAHSQHLDKLSSTPQL